MTLPSPTHWMVPVGVSRWGLALWNSVSYLKQNLTGLALLMWSSHIFVLPALLLAFGLNGSVNSGPLDPPQTLSSGDPWANHG